MKARLLVCLVAASLLPTLANAQNDDGLEQARRLLEGTILIDGHNDLPWAIRTAKAAPRDVEAYDLSQPTPGDTDIARLREGRVGAQFWSVYVPGEDASAGYARLQLEQIDIARRMIARYPEQLGLALSAEDDRERASRRAGSPRCSASRAAMRSRTPSVRCGPTTTSVSGT